MKNFKLSEIMPMIAYNHEIEIDDNNGITHYATFKKSMSYNEKIRACDNLQKLYVVMILPTIYSDVLKVIVSTGKYY